MGFPERLLSPTPRPDDLWIFLKKTAARLFALLIDAQIVLAFSSYKPIHISCLMQHLTKGTMPSKEPKYPAWNCLNMLVGCKGH